MINEELHTIIKGCIELNRQSQRAFYEKFYGFAASICNKYCHQDEEMIEIVNDGFLKIFKELHNFKPVFDDEEIALKGWMKRIMINTAIDHYRKYRKHQLMIDQNEHKTETLAYNGETSLDKISYDEILKAIKNLSPAYRTVFNLFVIDGLSHEEISKQLNISVGTSKSNLAKARMNLQKLLNSVKRIAV